MHEDLIRWVQTTLGEDITADRFSLLAHGANSEVFRVSGPGKPCVLKIYRAGCDTERHFEAWLDRMQKTPRVEGVEQLIAGQRIGSVACGLFSFMPGQPASLKANPLTRAHLDHLFSRVFPALDEACLINHDLNLRNVLTTGTTAGIIDLEYLFGFAPCPAPEFQYWINSDDWTCPMPSNKVSFEREGVTPYLAEMSAQPAAGPCRAQAWLKEYLAASAAYHRRRAQWLQTLSFAGKERALLYERTRAAALAAPEPEIVHTEALRLQVYYDAFAYTLFVQWQGHPDESDYLGTHYAIQADVDDFLAATGPLVAHAQLSDAARRLLQLNGESVIRMREILAGAPLPDTPARLAFKKTIPAHATDAATITAWLRNGGNPQAFVPTGWARKIPLSA